MGFLIWWRLRGSNYKMRMSGGHSLAAGLAAATSFGCSGVIWTPFGICDIMKKTLGAVVYERKDPYDTGERSL